MMASSKKWTALLFLFAALCFGEGCRKSGALATPPSADTTTGSGTKTDNSPPKDAVFDAKRPPARAEPWPDALQAAFEKTAEGALAYQESMPWRKNVCLDATLPAWQSTVALYKTELERNRGIQNLRDLVRIDSRFVSIRLRPQFEAVLDSALGPPNDPAFANPKPIPDSSHESGEASSDNGERPAVSVAHEGPKAVVDAVASVANGYKKETEAFTENEEMRREALAIVEGIEEKGEKPCDAFAFSNGDTLNQWAAKIGMGALYTNILEDLVFDKGDYFLGLCTTNGGLRIWQMKQPFVIKTSRKATDEMTRLNTGVEMVAELKILPSPAEGAGALFRTYKNGFWGRWENSLPALPLIHVTKATGNWTAEVVHDPGAKSFFAVSKAEIDAALARTDTTQKVGAAIAGFESGSQITEEQQDFLLSWCAMRDDEKDLLKSAEQILGNGNVPPNAAKSLVKALSQSLYLADPPVGEAFYNGRLFDYYTNYPKPNWKDRLAYMDMNQPKFGSREHPYGVIPRKTIGLLIRSYQALLQSDKSNPDMNYDIAVLCVLNDISNAGYSDLEGSSTVDAGGCALALKSLLDALKTGNNDSVESGRDFRALITDSPTFIPFRGRDRLWEGLLAKARVSPEDYLGRNSAAIQVYNTGR